jgi:TPP-dependent pyruvate/acetoin dehydrogenase alpha subunit
MKLNIPNYLKKQKKVKITKEELIAFETEVAERYENGEILAPIHLSKDNEDELIEIFQYIHKDDWVFSAWRNHYHALLHGFDRQELMDSIIQGRSMATSSNVNKFYSSAIVGGIIPIALGTAMALKRRGSDRKVWCFIGDMTFETGGFYECHKYAKNFNLPLQFVVEDNNLSVHTPTDTTWGVKKNIPSDVVYYRYENGYPHHGTGAWVNF